MRARLQPERHTEDVAGFEILFTFFLLAAGGAAALAMTAVIGERRKRRFVARVAAGLDTQVLDVESGDITMPLSFTVCGVRIHAAVRGDVEVWQLERADRSFAQPPFAVVYRDWLAPDARGLAPVGDLTSRLLVYGGDTDSARGILAAARAQLANVLGRRTRRCLIGDGRAFLEVTRRGLAVDDLKDAILRLDALLAVLAGGDALGLLPPSAGGAAVAGPRGIPIPALTG